MDNWPSKILILTSDETDHELFECMLGDDYKVMFTTDHSEAITISQREHPDIAIISCDCTEDDEHNKLDRPIITLIKEAAQIAEAAYVILFGDGSADCKINGFTDGADEYLPKPFNPIEFHSRLASITVLHERAIKAQGLAASARQTAFDAMEASSELGIVMRYADSINGITSFKELGDALISATNSIEIKCSYQFRLTDRTITDGNPLGALDERVMNELHERGPILDFGKRSIFNQSHTSILAKNMPDESSMKFGRLKDNLQIICSATENKICILNAELALKEQKSTETTQAIQRSYTQLNQISVELDNMEVEITQTMQWLKTELEEKLLFLGLSEEQETAVTDLLDDTIDRIGQSYNIGVEINNHLKETKGILNNVVSSL